MSGSVVGIDISEVSIKISRERWGGRRGLEFVASSVENYASRHTGPGFTAVTANMSLMTVVSLRAVLMAIAQLLTDGGHFVFTISHPFFWPTYWGYANEPWFRYSSEIAIEAPFAISLDPTQTLTTTHIHRPLEKYIQELRAARFHVDALVEPLPPPEIEAKYPSEWRYPRFLGVRCVSTE
jgi:SAM-dependent methyltransferase